MIMLDKKSLQYDIATLDYNIRELSKKLNHWMFGGATKISLVTAEQQLDALIKRRARLIERLKYVEEE